MTGNVPKDPEVKANRADIQRVVNSINPDLQERKENLPEACPVFTFPYTVL